jgi:hypothetical protein
MRKRFQDAVIVTQELGIQYLWINFLCICQGDKRDWEREGSRMSEVCANIYLTIAAASAKDGSMGYFTRCAARKYETFNIAVSEHTTGKLYAFLVRVEGERSKRVRVQAVGAPQRQGMDSPRTHLKPSKSVFRNRSKFFECNKEFHSEEGVYAEGRYLSVGEHLGVLASEPMELGEQLRYLWDHLTLIT